MAALVPCLVQLRAEFDEVLPGRDRASDGWIGDAAHQETDSDHNRDSRGLVHAIDVDADLGPGVDMQDFVDHLVGLRDKRLTYVIYNRVIWSASHGWKPRIYTGPSPHTEHAHVSASNKPAHEQDTRSWYLEEVPVALTDADKKWITAEMRKVVTGDADPGDREYSLGGMVTSIEVRTKGLPEKLDAIAAKLA